MRLRRRDTGETRSLSAELILGRLPSCDWPIDDGSISRRHAVVKQEAAGDWVLEDLGSSNGSKRNGQAGQRHVLRVGDVLTLGTVAFEVLDDPGTSALQEAARERARLRHELRADRRSRGLGDLSQQSLPIQLLAVALGLAVMAGLIYGIRYLAQWL